MEPTKAGSAHRKGRPGALNNPEVVENVPGHVIPILEREFDDFQTEAGKFLAGEKPEDQFIGFRLKQGVYGQRQADVQMIRVKLPFGGINPEQMDAFAEIAEHFAPLRKGHVTTRQNVQLHHIPLAQMTDVLRILGDAGLSSREGCGNTVRNVTGDPYAGICDDEPFDPTPYVGAYVRYFVRNEVCQLLPRKFKTAFSASNADRAITLIHDMGFIPRVREIDGQQVKGFAMISGGGTSIMPRVGGVFWEFARADDGEYLRVTEAVLRIFDRQEDLRANRARARIKFLIDRIGLEEFTKLVEQELEGDWVAERDFTPELFMHDEQANAPATPAGSSSPNGDNLEFDAFVRSNVRPQRQDGFSSAEVKVTRGDLTPEQFRGLGQIMRDFTGGYARVTVQQNVVLRWVRNELLYDVWTRLKELDLGDEGALEITDVVSCPGTDSCKLGITASMGLNQVVEERLEQMQVTDGLTRKIHVKMSGCPNGCSQHHVANIGLYGASIKVGDRHLPAYIPHLGGSYEDGDVAMGKRLKARIPAKRVPDAVERWVRHYESERIDGEEFNAFVERVGTAPFEEAISDLTMPIEFSLENMNHFIDWERTDPYKVERGEGECAI
ncbi:MAG: nitrite/sulfite reductase [Solirubrobacterales bacterium]